MTAALSQFGTDNSGVYLILTSSDVRQTFGDTEFCKNYCGYHSDTFRNNIDVKYAFVGNPDRCPLYGYSGSCYFGSAPNGNPAADSMTRTIAHELGEAVTDPRPGNTWYGPNSQEMADKCEMYAGTITLPTGTFNVQPLWVVSAGGYCTYSF